MDKLLIAPIGNGLKTDIVPFMAPEDSFQELENVFIYNGSIRRKPTISRQRDATSILESRLRVLLGVIDGTGAKFGNVPGNLAGKLGQQFSVGNTLYTVYQANGVMYLAPDDGSVGTFNIATLAYAFAGCTIGASIYFYPTLKVHHIYSSHGDSSSIYFDTAYSYKLGATGFEYISNGDSTWSGDNTCTYSSELYKSNVHRVLIVSSLSDTRGDLKYYNVVADTWTNFRPKYLAALTAADYVVTKCALVKYFARRIILFNTYEYNGADAIHYSNRIRYSEAGEIFNADSWYEYPDRSEKGGKIDLPSGETITAVEILNGRLIVFCKNSIYSVAFSGNKFLPLTVTPIDINIGSRSRTVVEIGDKLVFINPFGLYYCDGIKTELISNKINTFFTLNRYRTGGSTLFLDQKNSLLYITLRDSTSQNDHYTDTILLYNFINDTYSLLYDNYTALGLTNVTRNLSPYSSPSIIAGNNNGYMGNIGITFNKSDITLNVTALANPIPGIINLKIMNHSFNAIQGYIIQITNSALPGLNGSYLATKVDTDNMAIISDAAIAGYAGDAYVSIVDRINIVTKAFSPYLKDGKGVSISKVMFNVNKTDNDSRFGVSASISGHVFDPAISKSIETQSYNLLEAQQKRVWRSANFHTSAETITLQFGYSIPTLLDDSLPFQEFVVNAIILYTSPTRIF